MDKQLPNFEKFVIQTCEHHSKNQTNY